MARKRLRLARCRTAQILSIASILVRQTGARMKNEAIKRLPAEQAQGLGFVPEVAAALDSNRVVSQVLQEQITALEKRLKERVSLRPKYRLLNTMPGIGETLATTIMLETSSIHRSSRVGDFSLCCRCLDSLRESNGRKKCEGNIKYGNKYLAWAFVEAANFALHYCPQAKSFYKRKKHKTYRGLAIKALVRKLAPALPHAAGAQALRCGSMFHLTFRPK